jgi:hypothetical protein
MKDVSEKSGFIFQQFLSDFTVWDFKNKNHMFNSSWEIGSDIDQALAPANLVKFPKFRNFRLVENLAATKLDLFHSTPPLSIAESKILSYNFLGIKCIKNNSFYFD